jgi:hypothetical protein
VTDERADTKDTGELTVREYRLRGWGDAVISVMVVLFFAHVVQVGLPVVHTEVEILRTASMMSSERLRAVRLAREVDALDAELATRSTSVEVERWARRVHGMTPPRASAVRRVEVGHAR